MLCSAYKGVLPSELYFTYHGEGGKSRMELDLEVALEISQQVKAAHGSSSKPKRSAKQMVATRNQRRKAAMAARISEDDAFKMLSGQS